MEQFNVKNVIIQNKIIYFDFAGPNFALESPIVISFPPITSTNLIRLKVKKILERQKELYPVMLV